MAIIYLYDKTATNFTYNGQPLPEASQVHVDFLMNDEFYVTFQYPLDDEKRYKDIVKDKIVKAHTPDGMQPFRIIDTTKRMDSIEVEAWPLFFADMRNKLIRPLTLRSATGRQAFNEFKSQLLLETPFEITSNITEKHDYNTQDETEKENNPKQLYDALEVFKALVTRWQGEVVINGYDIRVLDRVGKNKEALLYEKKNIANFADKESIADIVTRVHGKSQWTEKEEDDEGKLIDVEYSIETTVDSSLIDAYSGVIFEKQYTNNDLRTKKELEDWLNLKFTTENIDKPNRNIEVETNVVDGLEINPGDGLVLKYILHDVDMQIRMIGYKYDGFANRYIAVYLGDPKQSLVGNLQNNISKVENNVSNIDKIVADVIINSLGQKMIYSDTEPTGNFKEGDTWFDNEGGMWFWDEEKADWIPHPYNKRTDIAEQLIKEAQKDIEEAKETADDAVGQINTAVSNAGFTSLDETISGVQTISNQAQINSGIAIGHSLDALQQASQAIDNTGSLNIRVDEVENTLSLTADKQEVDTLSGIVDTHKLDIQANAQGLALKANKDTVDRLEGTVSSLGTEVSAVAGQISNKVWKTDIESAVDGIEVGGRNLVKGTSDEYKTVSNTGWGTNMGTIEVEGNETITARLLVVPEDYSVAIQFVITNEDGTIVESRPGSFVQAGEERYVWRTYKMPPDAVSLWVQLRHRERLDPGVVNNVKYKKLKLEKGNKATDWTPAPEDTDAKIDYIETEFTQKYDSITSTVSDIDGRVSSQEQRVDSITRTIQEVTENVEGNTTKINQTIDTVDSHSQTIATIETDLDGKVEVSEYNTLVNTVDSTIRRIGDAEGNITQIEASVNGLQTTVADKADRTEVNQLATGYNVLVDKVALMDPSNKNLIVEEDLTNQTIDYNGNVSFTNSRRLTPFIEIKEGLKNLTLATSNATGSHWYGAKVHWYRRIGTYDTYLGSYNVQTFFDPGEWYGTISIPSSNPVPTHFRMEGAPISMRSEYKLEIGPEHTGFPPLNEYDDTEIYSQLSVLNNNINLRVSKGDVVNQINISDESILIDASRVHIGSTTIIDDGVITNSMVASDISADKVTTGTLDAANVSIINLNAHNIATGTLTGIRVEANEGLIGDWELGGGVLHSPLLSGGYTTLKATGNVAFATKSDSPYNTTGAGLQIWHNGQLRWNYGRGIITEGVVGGSNYFMLHSNAYIHIKPNSTTWHEGHLHPWSGRGDWSLGNSGSRWAGIALQSQPNVSSDMRDKKLIQDIPKGLLDHLIEIKPKMYQQKGKWHFGYIAQDVERAIYKYVSSIKKWDSMEAMNEYARSFAMLHKDESKLSLLYGEIAVIKEAEMQARMDRLENKLEELIA